MPTTDLLKPSELPNTDASNEVDAVEISEESVVYGRSFVILHPKHLRLDVAVSVDDLLKTWSNDADVETVVRWLSGTNRANDQLMVGLISPNLSQLKEFRTQLLDLIDKTAEANVAPVTGWLEEYLADRQAA